MSATIYLTSRHFTLFFGVFAAFFVVANLGDIIARVFMDIQSAFGLIRLFDADEEQSFPTYFSIVMLLFAALLLALIGYLTRQNKHADAAYWFGLSAVFLFLSIDEAASIHEVMVKPLRKFVGKEMGALHLMTWVLPYAALVLIVGAVYLRFLWRLPRRLAALMVISGTIYVGGAIGTELLTGWIFLQEHEQYSLGYYLASATEEALEMSGIALFIHALSDYVEKTYGTIQLRAGPL